MNHHNLIPSGRLNAKRRQRLIRRWVVIDIGYCVVLAMIGSVYAWSAFGESRFAAPTVVATDVQKLNATLAGLRKESAMLQDRYQSIQAVSNRPDWSILLSVLSQTLGDDVALNGVDCVPGTLAPAAGVAGDSAVRSRTLQINGVGRSQQVVTQYVLRLEALGFFDRVSMVQNGPQQLRGSPCVGFSLVCRLPGPIGGR